MLVGVHSYKKTWICGPWVLVMWHWCDTQTHFRNWVKVTMMLILVPIPMWDTQESWGPSLHGCTGVWASLTFDKLQISSSITKRWHLSNQYLLSTSITLFNQWCPAKNKPPSKVVRPMPYHIPQFVAGRPSPIFCKHHHKQLYQNNSKQPHKYCVEYEPSYNNSHYYLLPCPLSSIFRY